MDAQKLAELDQLEAEIRNQIEVEGILMRAIRDDKLYLKTHETFEAYVKDRYAAGKLLKGDWS